jgi:GWxTD domain-containing protein
MGVNRFLLLIGSTLIPGSLPAQAPEVRSALDSFRDSLQLASADQVRGFTRSTHQAKTNAVLELRQGFALLRAAEANGYLYDRARDAFRRAERLEPEWVYPLLGVGLAERGKGDWLAGEPANLGIRVGYGAYETAARALLEANARDPALTRAITELDYLARLLRDTVLTGDVLEALRRAADRNEPQILLSLARYERLTGSLQGSLDALERYSTAGGDPELGRIELARTLLAMEDSRGDSVYFAAALVDDSAVIAGLREDIAPITDREELERYDRLSGLERQTFLRDFWMNRARQDLRDPAERLSEHYRRLHYARRHLAYQGNRRHHNILDLYRNTDPGVDDRGTVYIRQGPPSVRIAPIIFGAAPNETWVYDRADGELVLHFRSGRLVPSILSLGGGDVPTDILLLSRQQISDIYLKILNWGPHGSARMIERERSIAVASAEIGTSTDAFELQFPQPLQVESDLVVIGRRDGRELMHLILAIPDSGRAGFPLRVRVSVFDSAGRSAAWLDTSVVAHPGGAGFAGARVELTVPPGHWRYRIASNSDQRGLVLPLGAVTIRPSGGTGLTISDIALGQSAGNVEWVMSPGDTASAHGVKRFSRGGDLQLYYQVTGLTSGENYRTSIAVYERRGERLGRRRLQLAYEERSQGVLQSSRRRVTLAELAPRDYWLEVKIVNAMGVEVITRKEFTILSVTH